MSTDPANTVPPKPANRWRQRVVLVLVFAVGMPIGAAILHGNSPVERLGFARFYPGCFFQQVTGFHCPGCGATRSLYALLHADLPQALAWNPLFVVFLPLILYSGGRLAYSAWTGRKAPASAFPPRAVAVLLAILIVFSIGRNIPVDPVNPLAPHPLLRAEPPEPPPTLTP